VLDELVSLCTFPDGSLVCAVSGGADSLALLALAVHVRGASSVTAIHVDHQLRAHSAAEADVVARVCASVGVSFRALTISVGGPGPNVEARARSARYAALPDDVCTGHTADDVAETVIANLLRGAGLDGVSPMVGTASTRSGPHRPLLRLRRAETHALCDWLGWTPIVDPMNSDPTLLRSRIRHEVIPLIDDVASRDVALLLARFAEVTADDVEVLETLASELDPTDARALSIAPPALARRAIRRWLIDEGVNDGQPASLATLDRIMTVVRGEVIATEITGGVRVARTEQRLRLEVPQFPDG
jgi:tRNA(Ile)-lysidine synthase